MNFASFMMEFKRKTFTDSELLDLYRALLLPRLIEEKMLILLRQGQVGKWFSGIGQEAISVGLTEALLPDEYIFPLHRNLGVFTSRKIPLWKLMAQWQGKETGFTQGRDRSFHFGTNEYHIVGMISHLGAMLGVADGIALSNKIKGEKRIAAVFSGDGGASEGDFHEALNVAAVWELPVLFVIENNGYGLSTPSKDQFRQKYFTDKGPGYGIEAYRVDGNNILEVYDTVKNLSTSMRHRPRPILLECLTFRMRGHEEASGTKYVPIELIEEWAQKDPVQNYEKYLQGLGILSDAEVETQKSNIRQEIDTSFHLAMEQPEPEQGIANQIKDVYAPDITNNLIPDYHDLPSDTPKEKKRLVDAISEGLGQAMELYPNLVLMGQDIAEYGGVFKVTQGFVEKYGKERVRNTPLCESAIVGAAYGLSIKGYKAMVEMQFADFVSCGFNQIVNNLAKSHYRWKQSADVLIRMPTGAGVGAGPFHSQSNEAWFFHVPGLKIVYPSSPIEAKGLLLSSVHDPNPVLFFEHKYLYRLPEIEENVPQAAYTLPLGQARFVQEGEEVTIVTYGMGVYWALQVSKELGVNAEIIDLRTLLPWDEERVLSSVKKTGKALVLHEDTLTGGIGAEIAAVIGKKAFSWLDAPVFRVGSADTPVPLAGVLEKQFLPIENLRIELHKLIQF